MQMASDAHAEEMRVFRATPAYRSNAPALDKRVDVRLDAVSRREALEHIASLGGLRLAFSRDVVSLGGTVSLRLEGVTVLEALQEATRHSGLRLQLSRSGQVIVRRATPPLPPPTTLRSVQVRQGTIAGVVIEAETGEPLPGVNVVVVGTTQGAVTDVDGAYAIPGVEAGTYDVQASFIGYTTQLVEDVRVTDGEITTVNFTLETDALGLDEVVVIGYGEVRRRDLTGAVGTVTPEKLEQMPVANVVEGIQGRVAGVQVQQTSGVPGETPVIRIRGGNSIQGDNDPLYVVDGVIGAYGAAELNPSDVQSIEILKDASATAIYGARGANGVVLITTKSGRSGQTRVEFSSYYGQQSVLDRLDYISGPEYAEVLNERARLAGEETPFPDPGTVPDTDWRDLITETAPQQNYFTAISGGADAFQYRISGEYLNQDGVVINSGYERIQLRSNFDATLSPWARTGLTLTIHRTTRDQIEQPRNEQNPFFQAYNAPPLVSPYNPDGTYNYALDPLEPGSQFGNPLERLNEETHSLRYHTGNLQAFVELEPVEGLTYRLNTAYSLAQEMNQDFIPSTTFVGRPRGGIGEQRRAESTSWLVENTLRYGRDVGRHSLGLLGGFTAQANTYDRVDVGNVGLLSDLFRFYNLSAGSADQRDIGSFFGDAQLLSAPFRFTYDYADRYLLTVNARADGSSRFGANNRWAFFPSAALGWVISDEPFLEGQAFFDLLKLRLSYGLVGNQAINSYQTLALFNDGVTVVGQDQQVAYFRRQQLPNPDLRWETTAQLDVGLEAEAYDGRLSLVFDVYDKVTRDLLLNRQIPSLTGFNSFTDNIGSLRNRGAELTLGFAPIVRQDVGLDFDLNLSANRNEVLDLGDVDSLIIQGGVGHRKETRDALILKEGLPVGSFRVYESCGIFQNQAEIDARPSVDAAAPGWQCLVDTNHDGKISDLDRVIVGDAEPAFTYGFNTNLRYKNTTLTMFWQGNYGGKVFNVDRFLNLQYLGEYYENYWRGEGTSSVYPSPNSSTFLTEDLVEDGSYLRLRTLTLAYNLPASLLGRVGVQGLRLYATGQNLVTFTGYSGSNPEANAYGGNNTTLGTDYSTYPLNRVYTLGINVTL